MDPSSSSSFATDADDESWLSQVRQKLQAAGHDRFEELAHDAEAELKRKVAAVPAGEASRPQRDALFQEFMQEMRGIARMQEEEVNVLVEEEKRERAWTRNLSASLSGGSVDGRIGASGMSASSSTSTVPPSVDEALLEEQRRIWDALRAGPYSGAVDDSGSSTEEETEERRRFVNRTGRARSGTISPPRATDHEQRSKSATVSPAPVYKPELTPGHTIYPPSSLHPPQVSSQGFFIPPSQPTQIQKQNTRRRTQSTSSTRELEMSKHVITPPSSVSTTNAFAVAGSQAQYSQAVSQQSQNQQAQQKHKVWIPPKPAYMVSNEISTNTMPNITNTSKDTKDSKDASTEASTKKRPRPVSHISTPALNLITTAAPVSSNPTPSANSATPTASMNKVSQRARSEDPTERKPEKLFGPVNSSNGKHPKAPDNTSSTTNSSSSQHYSQHTSNSNSNNSNSSSRRSTSTSTSATSESQPTISQPYAVWKPDMSSRNDTSSSTGVISSSQHAKHGNSQTSIVNPNEPVPYPPVVTSKGLSGSSRAEKNSSQVVEATGSISQSSSSGLSGSTSNSGGRNDEKTSHRAYKNQSARGQGSQSNANVAPSSRSSSVSSRSNADTDADDAAATTDVMASFWLQASGDYVDSNSTYQNSNSNSSSNSSARHQHSHNHTAPSSSSPPQQRMHLPTVREVFDQSTIRASNHGSSATRQSSNAIFAPSVGSSRSTSHSQNFSQSSSQDSDDVLKAVVPYDMSIWVPTQPQQPPSKIISSTASSSTSLTQRSSTSMTTQTSQSSLHSQDGFYAFAERARSDRHRIISAEYKTRAEVVAVFQKKVEDLMKDFVIALEKVDSMNSIAKFA